MCMMEVEAMFECRIHQVALGWPEFDLDRPDTNLAPLLNPLSQHIFKLSFCLWQECHICNLDSTKGVLSKLIFDHILRI